MLLTQKYAVAVSVCVHSLVDTKLPMQTVMVFQSNDENTVQVQITVVPGSVVVTVTKRDQTGEAVATEFYPAFFGFMHAYGIDG